MTLIAAKLPAYDFYVASQEHGFPSGAVVSPDEAFDDPQFAARGFVHEVEHPELPWPYRAPGVAYLFSGSPCAAPAAGTALGRTPGRAARFRFHRRGLAMYQSPTLHADGNRFTHVGLCVSDLERSLRYYCDVLGFEEKARLTVDDEDSANLLGVPGLNVELVFVERDGIRLEMLWHRPGHTGDGEARPMNQLGLTHLVLPGGRFRRPVRSYRRRRWGHRAAVRTRSSSTETEGS